MCTLVCVFTVFTALGKMTWSLYADGSETVSVEGRHAAEKCHLHVPPVVNAVDSN